MMFTEPQLFHNLMEKITESTIGYMQAQARAGAQALQLFDSWAGVLAPCDFKVFALPYVQKIIGSLKQFDIPLIYFANNGSTLLDYSVESIKDAIKRVGNKAVQGNIDPFALLLPKDELRGRIGRLLENASSARGHIFNLGHGIHQFTPPDQAKIAVDAVHELSSR